MQRISIGRRQIIAWITALPTAALAQPAQRKQRIGVFLPSGADDLELQARLRAFVEELARSGWVDGTNIQLMPCWGAGQIERMRKCASELVDVGPDVIVAVGGTVLAQLLQVTRSVPVVFTVVPDPIGAGFVESLARPGGNATGFLQFEFGIGAKWLELLKEISPRVRRAAVIRDPAISAGLGQFGAIQSVAPTLGIEISPINARDAQEIERGIKAFVQHSGDEGLIVTASALATIHRDFITALASQYKLPAVYFADLFVRSGGLASYGPNLIDQTRQTAAYVHRILKGEKLADLPVQAPNKYDLAINLKTANSLGLTLLGIAARPRQRGNRIARSGPRTRQCGRRSTGLIVAPEVASEAA